jgi:mRNA-degrading endonuclease toxin of MazEF toxin-antitoxin module
VVVPLTTQLKDENILRIRVMPSKDLRLRKASDALLDQVHTVDRSLILEELGPLDVRDFAKVENGVRFLLGH